MPWPLRFPLNFVIVVWIASLIGPSSVSAQWRDDYPVLRIGLVSGPSTAYGRARVEPFRLYLEDRLGVSVEVTTGRDYATVVSDLLTGRFHAGFLSAAAFAGADAACGGCIEPLVTPTTAEDETGYYSILLVPSASSIGGLDELEGARVAVAGPDSLAGRLLPLALFVEAGVGLESLDIFSAPSPAAAVQLLLDGAVDAAIAWSSLAGDPGAGYSRGVLALMVGDGRLAIEDVTIVWSSPLIPHGPLAALASLPEELKSELTTAMVELSKSDPDALFAVNGALGGGYVLAEPAAYEPLLLLTNPDLTLQP